MANKKRKIANSFRNTSYEHKLSAVVKSIQRWVMDVLKRGKNEKVLISEMIWEICGISKAQFFNIKKSLLQL